MLLGFTLRDELTQYNYNICSLLVHSLKHKKSGASHSLVKYPHAWPEHP